jgi:hypothetical protein
MRITNIITPLPRLAEVTAWLAFMVKSRSQIANFGAINRGYEGIGRIISKTAAYLVHLLWVEGIFHS